MGVDKTFSVIRPPFPSSRAQGERACLGAVLSVSVGSSHRGVGVLSLTSRSHTGHSHLPSSAILLPGMCINYCLFILCVRKVPQGGPLGMRLDFPHHPFCASCSRGDDPISFSSAILSSTCPFLIRQFISLFLGSTLSFISSLFLILFNASHV